MIGLVATTRRISRDVRKGIRDGRPARQLLDELRLQGGVRLLQAGQGREEQAQAAVRAADTGNLSVLVVRVAPPGEPDEQAVGSRGVGGGGVNEYQAVAYRTPCYNAEDTGAMRYYHVEEHRGQVVTVGLTANVGLE